MLSSTANEPETRRQLTGGRRRDTEKRKALEKYKKVIKLVEDLKNKKCTEEEQDKLSRTHFDSKRFEATKPVFCNSIAQEVIEKLEKRWQRSVEEENPSSSKRPK